MKNAWVALSLIVMMPEVLLAQTAHPSIGQYRRGKVLFAQRACASCHSLGGNVESLGPDLSKPEKPLTRAELLESIQEPSKTIKKGYETSALLLEKGEVITGRMIEKTDEAITLMIQKNLASEKITVPVSEIEEIAVQNVSAMPKGLADGLSVSQIDDLLAYLSAVGDPTFKEPVPATIPVKVSGVTLDPVEADSTYYSPEESMKRIHLAPGYRLELVASEPMIEEPVLCVWDGNSRMYVAEMRTYMQDAEGTDQDLPRSRVSLLEDTDGDGRMDRVTRFVDHLVLPRMILPLDDRIIINETYTQDYYSYRDTDGDGIADEKILLYRGGKDGGNLEHQNSGLTWGLDNWIYSARTGGLRHRFIDGKWTSERIYGESGQWGLAMDDLGRFFLSAAGGEKPAYGFQQLPQYGKMTLPNELEPGFESVYPVVRLDDVQGGRGRVHPEKQTLTLFTACGGQSIYRGDQMPEGFNGDYILPEPVGRLVRRAKVTQIDGKTVLSNAYESSEFIASTDKNFRPIWSTTGPDGCLYLVDMYRGIIQEGNWTRKGAYLRDRIDEQGFATNIGRGRIYRVVHESKKRPEPPRLLDKSTSELISELSHPNGWRRDTAQRLIVLRQDAAAIPALETLAKSGVSALGRVHALWTLDGLGAVSKPLIEVAMKDSDSRVQQTAIRLSESHLAQSPELVEAVAAVGFDSDLSVTIQAINSLRYADSERARQLIADLAGAYPANDIVLVSSQASIRYKEGDGGPTFAEMDPRTLEKMKRGYEAYTLVCIRCHGPDGKGAFASDGLQLAPSLVGSKRLLATSELPVRILLHGLMGPIEGKTYPGLMESMKREDDEWIASALTYTRNSFGNSAGPVSQDDVARIRRETSTRTQPYQLEELAEFMPIPYEIVSSWTFSASQNSGRARNAVDGKQDTRYDTGKPQAPGQWFQFDMGIPYELTELLLDTAMSKKDFPREYIVRLSDDGKSWSEPVLNGKGTSAYTSIRFAPGTTTRFLRITQTGKADSNFWSIHELSLFGRPSPPQHVASTSEVKPDLANQEPIRVLLIDGQNNHDWKATTPVMKSALELSGRFVVDVATAPPNQQDLSSFQPDFSPYQGILLNYNGGMWPPATQAAFVEAVLNGSGVVVVHAANNAFTPWPQYNDMIGIGWRNKDFGTRVVVDDATGNLVRVPQGDGPGAGHGSYHSYVVKSRFPDHPIMQGLPMEWRHAKDELYHGMRGPVGNLEVLATAFSSPESGGTGQHEPVIMTTTFGKGRIFHTSLGHSVESMSDIGFQTTLLRGTEWASTGTVTIPAPAAEDLPVDHVKNVTLAELEQLKQGTALYAASCARCHGMNGGGRVDSDERPLGPALAASSTIVRNPEALVRVICRGLGSSTQENACPGFNHSAEVTLVTDIVAMMTYLRESFAPELTTIDSDQVTAIVHQLTETRGPLTREMLSEYLPIPVAQMENWELTASDGQNAVQFAIDGNLRTRYTTGRYMEPGMWFKIDLKEEYQLERLVLDTRSSPGDYPRGYRITVSQDDQIWSEPVAAGTGTTAITKIDFPPVSTRFIMIQQTGSGGPFWSIHELEVYGKRSPRSAGR